MGVWRPLLSGALGIAGQARRPSAPHLAVGRLARSFTVVSALAVAARRVPARTGATRAEAAATRPGDGIILKPTTIWNRGITIAATRRQIWPWLVQMGYGRAGFYVPEWVDRLVWHVPAANSAVLLPQYADIAVGDVIADGPQYLAYWRVRVVEPERALVYWTRRHPWHGATVDPALAGALEGRERELLEGGTYAECSWGFFLDESGPDCTRLLIRTRALSSPWWLRRLPYGLIDAYVSRAVLRTIRRLAESAHGPVGWASAPAHPLSARVERRGLAAPLAPDGIEAGTLEEGVR